MESFMVLVISSMIRYIWFYFIKRFNTQARQPSLDTIWIIYCLPFKTWTCKIITATTLTLLFLVFISSLFWVVSSVSLYICFGVGIPDYYGHDHFWKSRVFNPPTGWLATSHGSLGHEFRRMLSWQKPGCLVRPKIHELGPTLLNIVFVERKEKIIKKKTDRFLEV